MSIPAFFEFLAASAFPNSAFSLALVKNESSLIEFFETLTSPTEIHMLGLGYQYNLQVIHICSLRNWTKALTWLGRYPILLNGVDSSGRTALHLAPTWETFKLLVNLGADPYAIDNSGRTAAMMQYLRGWVRFEKQVFQLQSDTLTVSGYEKITNRRYTPLPLWSETTVIWTWLNELDPSLALRFFPDNGSKDSYPTIPTSLRTQIKSELEARTIALLGPYIQATLSQTPLLTRIQHEPRLNKEYTLIASQDLPPGTLVALLSGAVKVKNDEAPLNPNYCFEQGNLFIDATQHGSSAELINESFPNLKIVTLRYNGVPYCCLISTQPILEGTPLYGFYGAEHDWDSTIHTELNESAKETWIEENQTRLFMEDSSLPFILETEEGFWEAVDFLNKKDYLIHRAPDLKLEQLLPKQI